MLPPGLDYYRLMLGCVVFVQRSRSLSEPQNISEQQLFS